MEIFNREAVERGIAGNVEIRLYDDLLHSKSALIDGELVIVGMSEFALGRLWPRQRLE